MNRNYTDKDRKQIAELEYNNTCKVGDPAIINDTETIGTVREVITDKTGLKAYVVESPDKKEVSVLYHRIMLYYKWISFLAHL